MVGCIRTAPAETTDDIVSSSVTRANATSLPASASLLRVVALFAAAAALWAALHPQTAGAKPLVTGITNLGDSEPLAYQRTVDAGARFVRIELNWPHTAPENQPASWQPSDPLDPNYNWSNTDVDVTRAEQAGLTPLLQVDGAPRWAQRCPTPNVLSVDAICDPDPAALAAFATAAAQRYSGRIAGLPRVSYWQALNEPNLTLFFFPQFNTDGKPLSPGLYRDLINSFYTAVKSVDQSNLVLLAGLGPNAVPMYTIGPMRFARELLCMTGVKEPHPTKGNCGGGVHFDIFAIQPYSTGSATHEGNVNDVQVGDLPKLQQLIRAADRAGRIKSVYRHTPLWVTEFSWDSQPPDPGGLPTSTLDRWTAEALYLAWKAGVSHFFWYSLRDGKHEAGKAYSDTLESGLYFRGESIEQDQPKDVLHVFRFPFVAFPTKKGLLFWGRTPGSTPGKVAIQAWNGNRWRGVRGSRADKNGIFTGTAPTRYGNHKKGTVRAVYQGEGTIPFSMRPVKDFRHMPFGDPTG